MFMVFFPFVVRVSVISNYPSTSNSFHLCRNNPFRQFESGIFPK